MITPSEAKMIPPMLYVDNKGQAQCSSDPDHYVRCKTNALNMPYYICFPCAIISFVEETLSENVVRTLYITDKEN
jgi:hypothetical protein